MAEGKLSLYLLSLCWSAYVVTAIQRADIFSYGTLSGDLTLAEGDDETSKVLSLPKPFYFYDTKFSELYVATNGIISAQDLPMEKQYVDDGFPTDFPVVAPFLADLDTSGGRGQIYYRLTETPSVLNRVAQEVQRGFPDARFTPTHAVVATWENVGAYEEHSRNAGPTNKINTFQAVVAYDETDSYALFLYPEDGLRFFGTRPKESYNVEIELPARVGFSRGEVTYLIFSRSEGPHYSVTSNQKSVKELYLVGNTGFPGVWLFHIGNRYSFGNIVPAAVSGLLATSHPGGHAITPDTTTPEYAELEEYPDSNFEPENEDEEEEDYPVTGRDPEFPEAAPGAGGRDQIPDSPPEPERHHAENADRVAYGGEDATLTYEPRRAPENARSQYASPAPSENLPEGDISRPQEQPQPPFEVVDVYPPQRNAPPLSPGGHVVSVEEDDVDFDTGVIQYSTENKETCARFQNQCSQNALCKDYPSGFCCHCQSGFYGNGRHCLPEGAPQRVSGKVRGTVTVGTTPVHLNGIDLHAYIVVGDGRAYTAVSEVPEPVGWALMPVAPIGELFGWLFALELPNSQAGFKITGAEFTRHAEIIFYPSNERLMIVQTAHGLDDDNHLTVDTAINGNVPFLPPGATVTMEPFKETYQYYPSVTTSASVREYSVVSAERGSESFSFQLRQNITYRDCRHGGRVTPETLQVSVERVFVMYVMEETILRYAITNKISPVGVETMGPELVNPCYAGSHDCDTTAQCIPLEGQVYQCQCATGYQGDGRNCYDVDECAEGLASCGPNAQCVNLPGAHRCQCHGGYQFGSDGRNCVDIDECQSSPCHVDASCTNGPGSFHCQCHPGFSGNGFYCSRQEGQPDRPSHKTQCEQHRDSLQSGLEPRGARPHMAFIPQCDLLGQYRPLQCHGSTGYCWCVDSRGQERADTRTPPGTPPRDCDKPDEPERPRTHCEQHRDNIQTSLDTYPSVGAFVPECDAEGKYRPLQCHGSTGNCWCVDSRGQERAGTRTLPGTPTKDCNEPDEPETPKTHCEHHRDNIQTGPDGYPTLGAFVPQCDANGQYTPLQCHGSSGHCWCVDDRGQERAGTRTPPGTPPKDCDKPDEPERPKTHCEQHRDNIKTSPEGYPLLGAFAPECDAYGQYKPLQCHGSTGHCWCVDNRGQERAGTRTPPGTPTKDCNKPDEPERPKTHCEQHRDNIQTSSEGYPVLGAFVPECDAYGQYKPLQCHGSTGHCWCVDSRGQERARTRTPPGTPTKDCNEPDEPERPKTHCEQHKDNIPTSPEGYPVLGAFVPECDAYGQYKPLQCHGSTGHCWCVDSRGQERAGTRTTSGTPTKDCNKPDEPERPKTHCEQHKDNIPTSPEGYPLLGAFVPECDAYGQYKPLQCHGSTGHCWCVDSRGQERAGTRTPSGTPTKDCNKPDEPVRPKTHCEQHKDNIPTSPEGYPLLGAFVPECDAYGQYKPLQCHGSTGHCWCVDSRGQERAGTRTPSGTPTKDCNKPDEPEHPKTHCEQHRDNIQTSSEGYPLLGAFVPECDAYGQYKPLQCHGSTGHCWCVDSRGQERARTRTPPGTPTKDCNEPDEPERPKTHCEQHRDNIQTSPEGYPLLGAFVPECDAYGQYIPLQCHGSTGHCWCVDSRGQERARTRTPPGTPTKNCNDPDEPERPKTHCEQQKDNIQTISEGYPLLGAFVPECDAYGQYIPLQCHGSTGHCWCVDNRGQERAGTRTPPGTPNKDCNKPDEPERPKTHCEQHRDNIPTSSEGYPLLGAFAPECDAYGQYIPLQCHGSTGHCWCVDNRGQERAGTRTLPGTPPRDCDKPDKPQRPKTHCEEHRDGIQTTSPEGYPLLGLFVPECDADGQYKALQCHGSTGHCWCVDSRGQERARTRTPPGTPTKDCDKPDEPERPKTHCENLRDNIQYGVGGFVPECELNGQYRPQQCHGSTGHCWCVDGRGKEITGTRTLPGTPPRDCNKPELDVHRPESVCERWRASLVEHYGGNPEAHHYLPQCEADGHFSPVQCYGDTSYCWCVDQDGREITGTRSHDAVKPACIPTVAPPTMHPLPRPDVTPPPSDITLLYAQGQQIGALPLNGTRLDPSSAKTLLALHGSIVVGVAYDCQENHVYWTDLSGRTINRASLAPGAEPEMLINTDLTSPEGLAVDVSRRLMFWVDSAPDKIERANLDGSGRRTLFDSDLVNPRAIIVVSSTGTLYWTDWNREAPKIESATVDGTDRKVVVSDGIGLPNALTYDAAARQICWADAGTKKLECVSPDGSGRTVVHPNLNYPFSMVYYRNHFFYTDWRRDGVIAVNKDSSKFTDEFLPDQRSHLYGITIATTNCLSAGSH